MAGRRASSTATSKQHLTKQAKNLRLQVEDSLGSKGIAPRCPTYLTPRQKTIYKWLVDNLSPSGFLGQLDKMTLANAAIIIARLEDIDTEINANEDSAFDRTINTMRDRYFTQYLKICQELCLSPAARAKMGTLAVNATKDNTDELMEALKNV